MKRCWFIAAAICLVATSVQAQESSGSGPCAIPKNLTRTRPNPDGPPIEIEVGVFLIDVIEVNEVEESFGADFGISLSWRDPRLSTAERGASLEDCRLKLSEIWHPQVNLINQRDVAVTQNIDVDVSDDGTVRYSERLTGTFSSTLDLRQFPFDTQRLRIRIASFEYGPADVKFVVRKGGQGGLQGIVVPGWEIAEIVTDTDIAPIQSDTGEHTRLDHVIIVERRSPYYFWKFVVPLILIVLMAWSVLWLHPRDYRASVGVSTASVFSLIAFLLGLRQMIPKVPYLTQLDELVLSATLLVFLALGKAVLTSRLVHSEKIDLAIRIDRWARWVYMGTLIVVVTAFLFLP